MVEEAPEAVGARSRARERGLVHGQRPRRRLGHERRNGRRLHLRGPRCRLRRRRLHAERHPARPAERHVPPRGRPGGLPRPPGRVPAPDRRGGAAPEGLGLRPLPAPPSTSSSAPARTLRDLHDRRADAAQGRPTSAPRLRFDTAPGSKPTTQSAEAYAPFRSGRTARRPVSRTCCPSRRPRCRTLRHLGYRLRRHGLARPKRGRQVPHVVLPPRRRVEVEERTGSSPGRERVDDARGTQTNVPGPASCVSSPSRSVSVPSRT